MINNKENIINKTISYIKKELNNAEGGHDWWHTYRVWNLAKKIAESEENKADRLDALGAIGIARAFNYGGYKNMPMHNPEIKPISNMTKEQYKNNQGPTVNHFYEKLFLLKDMMNTTTGKAIAKKRDLLMREYLDEFFCEWDEK